MPTGIFFFTVLRNYISELAVSFGRIRAKFPSSGKVDFGDVRGLCLRTNFARLRLEISPQSLLSLTMRYSFFFYKDKHFIKYARVIAEYGKQ